MEKETVKQSKSGKKLIILGFVAVVIVFLLYSRYQNPEIITPEAFDSVQRIAYGFYVILLACLGAITYGLYIFHREKVERNEKDLFTIIAITTWNLKSRKIFLVTFVGYGIFFALASGTLVYQPQINFKTDLNQEVPGGFVAPCCDETPGYMPKIVYNITEHIGLQIIPINFVLQVVVSYLVGLNMALAVSAYTISKKGRGASSIGAVAGLFIACPTCTGTFLSVFVGTASGIALTIALTQLQTLFIAISIPVLVITPFIMAKKLRNSDGSCKIEPNL